MVVGISSSRKLYTSGLTSRGGFRLSLPTNETYRLVLAEPSRKGYRAVARIQWLTTNGTARWALVKEGPGIKFSKIQPSSKKAEDKDVETDDDSDVETKTPDDVDNGTQCDADHWKGHGKDSDGDDDEDRDGKDGGVEVAHDGGHQDDHVIASNFDSEGDGSGGGQVSDCEGHDKDGDHKKHDDGDDVDCTVPATDGGTPTGNDGGVTPVDAGSPPPATDGGTPACVIVNGPCNSSSDCCIGLSCSSNICAPTLH